MTLTAVLVDGPARGEVREVRQWMLYVGMVWRVRREADLAVLFAGRAPAFPQFDDVVYRLSYVPVFGRAVLVGSVAEPPDPADLFTALCGEQAKRAAVGQPGAMAGESSGSASRL